MIEARDVVKRHGGQDVLKGVTLSVRDGEVAVILGPSGGGKSTFLRCINGLERLDGGEIEVGGETLSSNLSAESSANRMQNIRRQVGMVFQQFNLFPHLTVLGNVTEAPRQVLKKPRDEAEKDGRELLERVGLADKLHHRPESLSGGQQQRVAIARALAMKPKTILFDEPTSALDPKMTNEVLAVMADLAKSGLSMVVVTHGMSFARRVAHTVHVFKDGRVLESGPPAQVFESPREPETAEFLRAEAKA